MWFNGIAIQYFGRNDLCAVGTLTIEDQTQSQSLLDRPKPLCLSLKQGGTMEIDVFTVIEYKGFSYTDYRNGEREIIEPQLKERGYTNIQFFNIEADSFGPLIRGIHTVKDGKPVEFYYG